MEIKLIHEIDSNILSRTLGQIITIKSSTFLQYKNKRIEISLDLVDNYHIGSFYNVIGMIKNNVFIVRILSELKDFDYFLFESVLNKKREFFLM
jgi:hypothetical protein